ncbi:MAG: hypothetical protein QOE35_695 [Actinomycetota bacterium]
MPGEDEGPPGDPTSDAVRLEAAAARLETLGVALQRSIGETTESTASLSRTIGTVSVDLGQLIGDAVTALGKTRQIVLATDDSVGSVAVAFEQIERRLTAVATELSETVERQRRLEEDRPTPEAVGAAVGAEVAAALQVLTETFTTQLERLTAELEEERVQRAALVEQVQLLTEPSDPPLTEAAVGAQVEAALEALVHPWLTEMRDVLHSLEGRDDVAELQAVVEEGMAARDDGAVDRLRTDVLALAEDLATTAKRASAGQRAVEALQASVEQELPAEIERALATTSSEIKRDTEGLVSELHDDLALVMRQVVTGNEELEGLREAVAELAAQSDEPDEPKTDPGSQLTPVVRAARDDVLGAVGDLHEDLALVLKRLATGQRELDDVREALLASVAPAPVAAVDEDALAARVRDEVVGPLAEMGDDLSVLVRSVARTQEDIDALRVGLADLNDAVVAAQAAAEVEYEEAAEAEDVSEYDTGPDVTELVDGLRSDIDAGIGAAVSDLRDELDSVRRLVADQPEPLAAGDIRAEVEALLADVRDDLAVLAHQLATGQDDATGMYAQLLETLAASQGSLGADPDVAAAAAEAIGEQVSGEVGALAEELRGQFERLRTVVGRARTEAPAPDLSTLAPDVAAEVAASVEPVVAALHEDLTSLAGQLDDARVAIEQLHAEVAAAPTVTADIDVGAEVQAVVADLHEDLSLVLGQVVAAQEELQGVRLEVSAGQEDLRVVLDAVAAGQDDVRVVLDALIGGQDDVRALRDDVSAVLEVAGSPAPVVVPSDVDIEPLEIAIADLPAVVAGELRAELEVVADDIRARLRQLEAVAEEGTHVGGGGGIDSTALQAVRDEVQALAADLQTDLGTVIREIVASHDEVSQLRAEVANVVDDPAVAIDAVRVDVTAGLVDMAAELRSDLESLVGELHDDLGALMRQVVAGQDDLDALRQQLAEVAELAAASAGGDQVGDDLDRLTRDLQALRDRIPGGASATPARRRPRAHPNR